MKQKSGIVFFILGFVICIIKDFSYRRNENEFVKHNTYAQEDINDFGRRKRRNLMNEAPNGTIDDSNTLMRVGVNVSAANALIPALIQGVFPQLLEALEGKVALNATESAGECCKFGDFGGKVSAQLDGFYMNPINEKNVSIAVSSVPIFPSNSIRLTIDTGKVGAGFSKVGLAASFAAFIPVDCSIFAKVEAEIRSLIFVFDMYSEPENPNTFVLRPTDFHLEGLDFHFEPQMDATVCSVVAEFANVIFSLLADSMQKKLSEKIDEALLDFAIDSVPGSAFEIPTIPPLNISDNTLLLDYEIPRFYVEGDTILLEADLMPEARLNLPRWREGFKIVEPENSGKAFPEPSKSRLVNINVGADGLNNLIAKCWYLLWARFVPTERSKLSPLCQPSTYDPCPLPPYRQRFDIIDREYYALLAFGIHRHFFMNALVNPPQLEFESGSLANGWTSVDLLLEGVTMVGGLKEVVAEMTGYVNILASSLEYDPVDGKFRGLQITDLSLDDLEIHYTIRPLRKGSMNIILNMIKRVMNGIIKRTLLDKINTAITDALSSIPEIPIIPDFPSKGSSLHIDLTGVGIDGFSATKRVQSYANLGAGVSLKVVSNETSTLPNTTRSYKKDMNLNAKPQKSTMQKDLEEKMLEFAKDSDRNPNAHFSWYYQDFESQIMEVHSYHYNEESEFTEYGISDVFF